MRHDMYKVIVERPRRGKDRDAVARRLRSDHEGPAHLSMRAGYGYRALNENLAPLRRYLAATGLIRRNRNYVSWNRREKARLAAEEAKALARRRVIDKRTQLLLLDGEWYEVTLALVSEFTAPPLPLSKPLRASELSQPPYVAYDVVLRHVVRDWKSNTNNGKARENLYGSSGLYAVQKRQLSKREIERHGLRGEG